MMFASDLPLELVSLSFLVCCLFCSKKFKVRDRLVCCLFCSKKLKVRGRLVCSLDTQETKNCVFCSNKFYVRENVVAIIKLLFSDDTYYLRSQAYINKI